MVESGSCWFLLTSGMREEERRSGDGAVCVIISGQTKLNGSVSAGRNPPFAEVSLVEGGGRRAEESEPDLI